MSIKYANITKHKNRMKALFVFHVLPQLWLSKVCRKEVCGFLQIWDALLTGWNCDQRFFWTCQAIDYDCFRPWNALSSSGNLSYNLSKRFLYANLSRIINSSLVYLNPSYRWLYMHNFDAIYSRFAIRNNQSLRTSEAYVYNMHDIM